MLKAKKKITKHELKEDALVTTLGKAEFLYETNKRMIGIVAGAVAVIVIGLLVVDKNRQDANDQATTTLAAILQFYDNSSYQTAIDGIPERNLPGLRSIVENYGGSEMGNVARYYLATSYFAIGNVDEALRHFQDVSLSDPMLRAAALAGEAACLEAQRRHREAAVVFEDAAGVDPKNPNTAEYLSSSARLYAAAGEKEKALNLFKRIMEDYPNSVLAREAERHIAGLSV